MNKSKKKHNEMVESAIFLNIFILCEIKKIVKGELILSLLFIDLQKK